MAKLVKMGATGSLGITLPKEKLDEPGLEAGDRVGIVSTDDPDVLEIQLPAKQEE